MINCIYSFSFDIEIVVIPITSEMWTIMFLMLISLLQQAGWKMKISGMDQRQKNTVKHGQLYFNQIYSLKGVKQCYS